MLPPDTIDQLARELYDARKSRTQVRHFSKRFPEMTIDDGYAIQRAWVALEARRRPHDQGPQDRPDLARDAAGEPDHRARLRAADGRHVLRAGHRHRRQPLHRAAHRGRAGVHPRQAAEGAGRDAVRRALGHRVRDAGDRDHRRAHRAVRPRHQGRCARSSTRSATSPPTPASCSAAGRCGRRDVDLRWVGALLYKNGVIEETGPRRRRAEPPGHRRRLAGQQDRAVRRAAERRRRRARAARSRARPRPRPATASTSTTGRSAAVAFRFV